MRLAAHFGPLRAVRCDGPEQLVSAADALGRRAGVITTLTQRCGELRAS